MSRDLGFSTAVGHFVVRTATIYSEWTSLLERDMSQGENRSLSPRAGVLGFVHDILIRW